MRTIHSTAPLLAVSPLCSLSGHQVSPTHHPHQHQALGQTMSSSPCFSYRCRWVSCQWPTTGCRACSSGTLITRACSRSAELCGLLCLRWKPWSAMLAAARLKLSRTWLKQEQPAQLHWRLHSRASRSWNTLALVCSTTWQGVKPPWRLAPACCTLHADSKHLPTRFATVVSLQTLLVSETF